MMVHLELGERVQKSTLQITSRQAGQPRHDEHANNAVHFKFKNSINNKLWP